jgi:hypothetical protein
MTRLLSAAARRLTDTLGELKARVREAIAGETGKAVGEAVRLAVATALTGETHHDPVPSQLRPSVDPWDDPAADRWADPNGWQDADDAPPPPLPNPALNAADRTRLAVAAGLAAGRWVLARGSLPVAIAVGGLVALAVLFGGPATHAAATALAAAADLSAVSQALRPHRPLGLE